jgi:hypothetical protein
VTAAKSAARIDAEARHLPSLIAYFKTLKFVSEDAGTASRQYQTAFGKHDSDIAELVCSYNSF